MVTQAGHEQATGAGSAAAPLSAAASERAQLCSLLLKVGENAPTLCSPWDTGDLAAHLLVRETRIDALPGIAIPALRGHTEALQARVRAALPFAEIVEQLRRGPSLRTPLGLPGIRDRANLGEYFMHHEDVLRAEPGWHVRELPASESALLWNAARSLAPWMLRGIKDTRVTLATPEGAERSVGRAESKYRVTVTGAPSELLLYLSGRRTIAQVRIGGDPAGQARLAAAKRGL
jgi:uncharacterized protein (TIGR03085 family)